MLNEKRPLGKIAKRALYSIHPAITDYAAALPGGISGFSPRMISLVMMNF